MSGGFRAAGDTTWFFEKLLHPPQKEQGQHWRSGLCKIGPRISLNITETSMAIRDQDLSSEAPDTVNTNSDIVTSLQARGQGYLVVKAVQSTWTDGLHVRSPKHHYTYTILPDNC